MRTVITKFIFINALMGLIICGMYNYFHPIRKVDTDRIIYSGKVINIETENNYNENSEFEQETYAIIEGEKESVSIKLKDEEKDKIKVNDICNYEEKYGEFVFSNENATPTKGSKFWIFLSIVELGGIVFLIFKNDEGDN